MVIFVSSSERVARKFRIEQDTAVAVQFPDKARLHRQQKSKKLKARCAEKKMQAVEEFASVLRLRSGRRIEQWESLLETISELKVGHRTGRQEKRVLKRRPKTYKLMQTPRNPNRNRYATAA